MTRHGVNAASMEKLKILCGIECSDEASQVYNSLSTVQMDDYGLATAIVKSRADHLQNSPATSVSIYI